VVPTYTLQAQLVVQVAVGGNLHGALLQLFTNSPPVFAPNALAATLVIPVYTGYVPAQAAVWGTPFVNSRLQGEVSGGIFTFAVTASGAPNVITGAALMDSTSTNILGIDIFANPITLTNDFDGFTYYLRWVNTGV
jgi:hypothetical protein